MQGRARGFTLIELLIVVAIIAILAAIAVPNFLEAQVRAKVSRVQSDMRTIATALESYRVDYPRYPDWDFVVFRFCLTTPVAYITSFSSTFVDPFSYQLADPFDPTDGWRAFFIYESTTFWDFPDEDGGDRPPKPANALMNLWYPDFPAATEASVWSLKSYGPWGPRGPWDVGDQPYDASNGTVSFGRIRRFGP